MWLVASISPWRLKHDVTLYPCHRSKLKNPTCRKIYNIRTRRKLVRKPGTSLRFEFAVRVKYGSPQVRSDPILPLCVVTQLYRASRSVCAGALYKDLSLWPETLSTAWLGHIRLDPGARSCLPLRKTGSLRTFSLLPPPSSAILHTNGIWLSWRQLLFDIFYYLFSQYDNNHLLHNDDIFHV